MDGNRRWAEKHSLPTAEGHRAGVKSLHTAIENLGKYRLPYLTVYGFSTENWHRPKDEVNTLLGLLEEILPSETQGLHNNNVRLQHLGSLAGLSPGLKEAIKQATIMTKDNKGMVFSVAFNYGGRDELTRAIRRMVTDGIPPDKINEKLIGNYLYTVGMPDVDLVIRTGGENRLSNFLTWQTTYSELYFTDVLWPDFNAAEIDKALLFYSRKQRRFGA
ncbi:MAG: di-trans,poly-cis-decaprenylcistransferase [Dehalococcoidales bacterium]|nr:di-trans,poly-cis-decaprenylcistransferase [Dehalococcoidales bacterium]